MQIRTQESRISPDHLVKCDFAVLEGGPTMPGVDAQSKEAELTNPDCLGSLTPRAIELNCKVF